MNESIAATAAPRRLVLLVKSQKFAGMAGYYLSQGRWHAIKHDKPVPKSAPVAAHPTAGGVHMPKQHLSDAEWEQLKLPDSNSNAKTFNSQLEKLKGYSDAGNVTAILGMPLGTNTYSKLISKVANHLLGQYGSEHATAPGQKAGAHPAIQAAPDADHHELANQAAQQKADQAAAAPNIEPAAPNITEPPPNITVATGLAMPAFIEGKTTTGVVDYYQGQAQKIIDMATSGDVDGLISMMDAGLKPNGKGKISNTFAGKTANSKMLLKLHAGALQLAGGKVAAVMEANTPTPAPAIEPEPAPVTVAEPKPEPTPAPVQSASKVSQIPWDTQLLPDANKNSKSHNGKVAQIKAMAEAGDLAGLEAFKAGTNTYGVKQKKLAALAAAALKEAEPVAAPVAEPVAVAPAPIDPLTKFSNAISWAGSASEAGDKAFAYLKEQGTSPETVGHVVDVLKNNGYDELAAGFQGAKDKAAAISAAKAQPAPEPGPKEGDTKQGADGMLVLKDGHWVKVEAEKPAEPAATGLDAIQIPVFDGGTSWDGHYTKIATALLEKVKAEGADAFKGVVVNHAGGQISIKLAGYKLKKISTDSIYERQKKMAQFVADLKALTGKPKKAPKAKAAPAPAAAPSHPFGVETMDSWKQTGPQGGSNPGGKFQDADGVEWYCKFPANDDVAKSEVLAAKLYAAAGIAGQDAKLVTKDGKLGIASKWQTVSKLAPAALAKADGVAAGFAVDAWLGNWDVVGLGYDNLQVDANGKAMRVDAGGSLEYRAQGGKKAFGEHVVEIDSLRDGKINPQSAAVFGKLSEADLTASVSKVLGVSDAKIHALVHAFGPGDAAAKQKMIDTLIARKADLAAKYPKAKKEKKVKPFKAEKISAPPSFLNWGGSGKSGPSSKEYLNAANESAVQAIYAAAQTGSLEAVQGLSASIYNKESGEVTGSAPVLDHPSQHVKGYAQQAINEINYQLNPPKRFRFEGGHPLHSLNSAYPSHKGPLHSVVSKVGKFILLGEPGTISIDSLALPKHTYQSGAITQATFSPAARKAIAAMPETQKQAIKSYTGSGYQQINSSLWEGNASGAAKSAGEALHALGHDITPGTVLSRKISVHGGDLAQILKSSGKILQEPAIMSTSIRPSSWSGNVQLKMHVGPGVKGLWVGKGSVGSNGALSNHSGEDELILPPNTRLLILSVKTSSGPDADGFGNGVGHVIEAVILPTQASS